MGQSKGAIEPSQSPQMLPPESSGNTKHNQNKKDSLVSQGADNGACKAKGAMEGNVGNLKLGKENEVTKLKKDTERGPPKIVKNTNSPNPVHVTSKQDSVAHTENIKTEPQGNKVQPNSETRTKNEIPAKTEKVASMSGSKSTMENAGSRTNVEESEKENDSISRQKCDLPNEKADACETTFCSKTCDMKDVKTSNVVRCYGY